MSESSLTSGCPLCREAGGRLVWSGAQLRLIRADDALHPAFYRLVWQSHVAEFSELDPLQRAVCMDALVEVELALRELLRPTKINLASLGNLVPHLHWHLIARWPQDPHWPQPVWAQAQREADPEHLRWLRDRLPDLERELASRLQQRFPALD